MEGLLNRTGPLRLPLSPLEGLLATVLLREDSSLPEFAIAPADARFNCSVLLFDHGYVNSVGVIELLAFVQDEFSVLMPDEELLSDEFYTLDGITTVVGRLAGERVGATT